jgi:hypothetical protein
MIDYAEEVGTLTAPAKAEMTTQSYIAPDGTEHSPAPPQPTSSGATISSGVVVALFFAYLGTTFTAMM